MSFGAACNPFSGLSLPDFSFLGAGSLATSAYLTATRVGAHSLGS